MLNNTSWESTMEPLGHFRYDTTFDVTNHNDSHTLTALRVGEGKKVLDVGCSVAVIAPFLRSRKCTVIGIDNDREALEIAAERCDQVYQVDLNEIDPVLPELPQDFDVIICNDVLEHLLDPSYVLSALRSRLKENGFLLASIPNIAHGSIRLSLWKGNWTYRTKGLLDNTHLRFFTRESIAEVFSLSGWFVAEWSYTTAPYTIDLDLPLEAFPENLVRELDQDPSSKIYQYVVKAYKREALAVADLFDNERKKWNQERVRMTLEMSRLSNEVIEKGQRVQALSAEVENLDRSVDDLALKLTSLSAEHTTLVRYQREWERERQRKNELTRLTSSLHHRLSAVEMHNQALISDTTKLRQERDRLQQESDRYRYFYESLRFSRVGKLAHRLGTIRTVTRTGWRLWGSGPHFRAMFVKASKVLATEGPVQLARYGVKKLSHPELRYDDVTTPLNAEEDIEGYQVWLAQHGLTRETRETMSSDMQTWNSQPLISILMPVYNVKHAWLSKAIDSVRKQIYPFWELCIVDDASTYSTTKQYLKTLEAEADPRIHLRFASENKGISAATNQALAMATGEFVALMDHDDELAEHALYRVAQQLHLTPNIDIVYSDEDKIDENGRRFSPFFKPDWSPTLLLGMNYVSHLGVYRKALAESAGGFQTRMDGAQDYDFLLRCVENTDRIVHIPDVLYHWRTLTTSTAASMDAKPYVINAGLHAVSEHLQRLHIMAQAESGSIPARFRIAWQLTDWPSVSVIIPTKDRLDLLTTCLKGLQKTSYPQPLEIIIVDNGSTNAETQAFLKQCPYHVVSAPGSFNFSALVNQGVNEAQGELILILNNDIEFPEPSWLRTMVGHLQMPGVGIVGPKLVYPDGRVQHGGIILGLGGIAGHAFRLSPSEAYGYFGLQQVAHEVSAVTGACLLTYRTVFDQVGGFREDFPVNFNDVAFCLDTRSFGHRVVYCPDSTLIHHESASRAPHVEPWEETRFRQAYKIYDPYYSPRLSLLPSHTFGFPRPEEERFSELL